MKRLIEHSPSGSLQQTLIRAARNAAPTASSKQLVLDAVAKSLAAGAAGTGSTPGGDGAAVLQWVGGTSVKLLTAAKWAACLGVVGFGAYALLPTQEPAATRTRDEVAAVAPALPPEPPAAMAPVAPEARDTPEAASANPTSIGQEHGRAAAAPRAPRARGERAPHPSARATRRHAATGPAPSSAAAPVGAPSLGDRAESPAAAAIDSRPGERALEPSSAAPGGAPPSTPPSRAGLADTSLNEELSRLAAVRASIQDGDVPRSRRMLSEYWRRFPKGYLAPEGQALERRMRALQ